MKHRLLLLILFVFATSVAGWAQKSTAPSYTVKGVLIDSLTQEGEPYATIKIAKKNAPDKAVKMAVTGANGKFQEKLNVAAGNYIITISSIGKAPIVKEFTLKPSVKEVDLGTMISSEANNVLKGVEVVAQKPLVKVDVDKIEYNIEDDPDSKSNSILEMLRKVPLVTVDGEDNVQVNGSSSFKIHVNGKPNNMMSNNPKLPRTESLKDTIERIMPYWESDIFPSLKTAHTLLVVAHGNSLRGIIKHLKNISDEDIIKLNLPTAVPYVFEFDENLNVANDYFLGNPEEIKKLMEAVANQGKKK